MNKILIAVVALWLAACGAESPPAAAAGCDMALPRPGSNEKLRAPVRIADGLEVIVADVYIPPGVAVPRHYHPGEEFLYVIQGSAVHVEEGQPDRLLSAGDAYVIPPEAVHAPYGGPDGGRAVVLSASAAACSAAASPST